MFADNIIEKIYSDDNLNTVPVEYASKVIAIVQDVLEEIKEEKPYVTISELFE